MDDGVQSRDLESWVRIGWNGSRTLFSLIGKAVKFYKQNKNKNNQTVEQKTDASKETNKVKEGMVYDDAESFLRASANYNSVDMQSIRIYDRKELDDMLELSKVANVDILVTRRPEYLEDVIFKANRDGSKELVTLTDHEKDMINIFCSYDENTNSYLALKDAYQITFRAKDIDKVKLIGEELQRRAMIRAKSPEKIRKSPPDFRKYMSLAKQGKLKKDRGIKETAKNVARRAVKIVR